MTADMVLSRLHGVKRTGRGRWLACCPAHESKSRASLAVRELDDGRVLVHDFGGCGAEEVLGALGLTFDALFPERAASDPTRRERRPFSAADVLEAVAAEALIAATAASDVAQGRILPAADRARLWTAAGRLAAAVEVMHGR